MQTNTNTSIKQAEKATVELKSVTRGYGERWDREEVISNFDLTVNPGELTVLVGPSGCGKTTLVNLVAGFDSPESGEISINGEPITGPGHDRMVVFQETALMPWLTSYQNVVFGPKLRGDWSEQELREKSSGICW